ncbi:hypothetical protein F2P81_002723 [Scophthalmus maximus]|uniref:Uncharacterized protein n=1 Tax=Scophthalmus maximus TaxID=52904 RepID=A0A6A4TSH9_SCOMX|nr:hypothetical protein F2P81_002723 [Scophthalmus maximus]
MFSRCNAADANGDDVTVTRQHAPPPCSSSSSSLLCDFHLRTFRMPKCMKTSRAKDGGLANGGLGPARDEHRRLAEDRPNTGLHHERHRPAASVK